MDEFLVHAVFRYFRSDIHLQEILDLLARGADPNRQMTSGFTPLQAAAMCNKGIEIVKELIRSGADVNLDNHLGYTALHLAIIVRNFYVVDELLQSGAFVNAKTYVNITPLHEAASGSRFLQPDRRIIEKLLQQADIDLNPVDFYGNTPLLIAINDGNFEAVTLLLKAGANPNIPNKISDTPLHIAFSKKAYYIASWLLLNGASIYAVNRNAQTPMDVFFENIDYEPSRRLSHSLLLQFIALKYRITDDLQKKLEIFPVLSQFMKICCKEVSCMSNDFVTDQITVHDFIWNCFEVARKPKHFKILVMRIHKPIIDRLLKGFYPTYSGLLLKRVSTLNLLPILEIVVDARKKSKWRDHPILFSKVDIVHLLSQYLLTLDIFCLIVAISNVKIPETMRNIRKYTFSFH